MSRTERSIDEEAANRAAARPKPVDLAARIRARRKAMHPNALGRFEGLVAEAAAGIVIAGLGWERVDVKNPHPAAVGLLERLGRYRGLAIGRNSRVEGLYLVDEGRRLVHVEVTGAFTTSRWPGLRRSDTAHKLHSRLGLTRNAALACGISPPVPVVLTSHLPLPDTEAGRVVLAMADLGVTVVELNEDGTIRDSYPPQRLWDLLGQSA